MTLPRLIPASDLPTAGAHVPGIAVRPALALAGSLLALLVFGSSGWTVVGILLAVSAAIAPRYLLGWVLILLLAVGELRHPASLRWQLLVLIAGLHLLHVLATFALELPWRSWVQPAVFRGPLLRLVAIQLPVQGVAVLALALLAPAHDGHRPLTAAVLAPIGAVALVALALVLLGPRDDESPAAGR